MELIQNSFSDYLQGNVDFDKAKANFETAIKERYPDITEVQWPVWAMKLILDEDDFEKPDR